MRFKTFGKNGTWNDGTIVRDERGINFIESKLNEFKVSEIGKYKTLADMKQFIKA